MQATEKEQPASNFCISDAENCEVFRELNCPSTNSLQTIGPISKARTGSTSDNQDFLGGKATILQIKAPCGNWQSRCCIPEQNECVLISLRIQNKANLTASAMSPEISLGDSDSGCQIESRLLAIKSSSRRNANKSAYRIQVVGAPPKMTNDLVRRFLHTSPLDLCWRPLQRTAGCIEAARPGRTYPRRSSQGHVPSFRL